MVVEANRGKFMLVEVIQHKLMLVEADRGYVRGSGRQSGKLHGDKGRLG